MSSISRETPPRRKSEELLRAVKAQDYQAVCAALDAGANVHWNHEEALFNAVQGDNRKIIKLLIEHGADPSGDHGITFGIPIAGDSPETLKLLLKADMGRRVDLDRLARQAASGGHAKALEILLDHGADPLNSFFDENGDLLQSNCPECARVRLERMKDVPPPIAQRIAEAVGGYAKALAAKWLTQQILNQPGQSRK